MTRYNIVCVVSDDTPPDTMLAMPYLDAEPEGRWIRFPSAVLNRPQCAPSRATIFTGRTWRNHGFPNNQASDTFDNAVVPEANLLGATMQRAGYRTGMFGKYGHAIDGDPDLNAGQAVGWDHWENFVNGGGQGSYTNFTLYTNGVETTYNSGEYSTDKLFADAIDWIEAVQASGPFFCYIATNAPHQAAVPASRHDSSFDTGDLVRRPNFNPATVPDYPAWRDDTAQISGATLTNLDDDHVEALKCQLAVDEGMEDLITALQSAGVLNETVIVHLGDNSNLYGEHRYTDKGHLYRECLNPHLMIRWPGATARTSTAIASNIDLAPTFVDIARTHLAYAPDGMSLRPLIEGTIDDDQWRTDILVERPGNQDYQGRGVYTADWSYALYNDGAELFDLDADPYQQTNLAQTNTDQLADMRDRMTMLERDLPAWPYGS